MVKIVGIQNQFQNFPESLAAGLLDQTCLEGPVKSNNIQNCLCEILLRPASIILGNEVSP